MPRPKRNPGLFDIFVNARYLSARQKLEKGLSLFAIGCAPFILVTGVILLTSLNPNSNLKVLPCLGIFCANWIGPLLWWLLVGRRKSS
jgi:hypothetical protein